MVGGYARRTGGMTRFMESAEALLTDSWREQVERRLLVGGVMVVLVITIMLAAELIR
jgi:hypothetical protein